MGSRSILLLITALHSVHHFKEVRLFQNRTIKNHIETGVLGVFLNSSLDISVFNFI